MENCCQEEIIKMDTIIETDDKNLEQDFYLNKQSRSEERLSICHQCPEIRNLDICNQCGCFMQIKTRIFFATCPLGKW